MPTTHRLTPGEPITLEGMPTRAKPFGQDRDKAKAEFKSLRKELIQLQRRFYAEGKAKLLIVFQAMDAGGKDGTIRSVFKGVNPQGVAVTSFKVPSREELAHDFLWRIHRAVPGTGMIGVFNRSHYEDVLVVRVENIVPETVWRARYDLINHFEKMLVETGTIVLKFFLHISREEQRERFQERLDDPEKNWKFSSEDLKKRERWDLYMAAYEDALRRCTTSWAPWHVIPAGQNWYRDLAVSRVIVNALRVHNPQYPSVTEDLSHIEVR